MKILVTLLYRLAKADMVFWLMPPLMALLVAGTLAQRWMGLWPAMEMFFSGFVIWAGPVPLPGAYTLLGILSINVTLKFLLKSQWRMRKIGIHLSHLGTIILLLGGLLTAMTAHEYYMIIPERQETPFIYDYHERALNIFENNRQIARLDFDDIKSWNLSTLPFRLNVQSHCQNCEIKKRQEQPGYDPDQPWQGMARFMIFEAKPPEKDPEADLSALEFTVTGTEADGIYVAFDAMPGPIEFIVGEKHYTLMFGKRQSILPFSIALKDFVKDDYGGTAMARSYHSDVIIKDGSLEWPVRIEMNQPLRYRGYTFFQSSFEQSMDSETTILAVVENKGRLFPYIGSIVLSLGLILHFILSLTSRPKENRA
ncbi:MAG: cytochrome c biogenesis protein ResB [Rhodospirillales bacterium]|nr:cytochrome c biogenesis protein ResB [Rhodospirillales bacterium]